MGHNLAGSKVGDLLTRDGVNGIDLMSDVMGGKSTSTLVKRARFAGRMIPWANESKVSFFPLDISTVRDFMKTLETASAIKECGETLNFLVHVVGVDSPLDAREHPAIKGAIRGARERTKDFKQSRVLSVREVKILESLLFSQDVDPVDRYGAGVFLFQIYSRARVSDIRNLSRFEVDINGDRGYLEARTLDHKAAKRVGGLGQLLVLVAPIQGLSEAPWGKEFLKVSDSVGVKLSEGRRGPLLPRLLPSGE